jgi:hypothetical protein
VLGVGMAVPRPRIPHADATIKAQPAAPSSATAGDVVETQPSQVDEEKAWEHEDGPQGAERPAESSEPEQVTARDAVERSVAIDLVSKAKALPGVSPKHEAAREVSIAPAGIPKRRGAVWLSFLLLAAAAASGGYWFRDRLRPRLWSVVRDVTRAVAAGANTRSMPAATASVAPAPSAIPSTVPSAPEPAVPAPAAAAGGPATSSPGRDVAFAAPSASTSPPARLVRPLPASLATNPAASGSARPAANKPDRDERLPSTE